MYPFLRFVFHTYRIIITYIYGNVNCLYTFFRFLLISCENVRFLTIFTHLFLKKYKKSNLTHTFFMKISVIKRAAFLTCFFPFVFVSCHSFKKQPSKDTPPAAVERQFPDRGNALDAYERTEAFEPSETPVAPADPTLWNVADVDVSFVDVSRKLISFTFDDAPGKTLENILAVFAGFNEENPDCKATATVFCNGNRIDVASSHTLLAAKALGMELGNHSFSHPDLTTLTKTLLQEEIDKTDQILQDIDGNAQHLFRAPYGRINDQVKALVETPILDWTIDTLDWSGVSADEIYNTVWNKRFSGAIVLMHDGYLETVTALKRLLPDLKADGYQVLGVSAMAKAHRCPLRKGSVYIRARKTEDRNK